MFYAWPLSRCSRAAGPATQCATTLGARDLGDVVWFTLWQARSTAVTVAVGLAPGVRRAPGTTSPDGVCCSRLVTVPFVLPTVVVGAAFLALLPDSVDRTVGAVIVAHVFFNVAVVVRVVGALWEHLPTDLEAAAATLGAAPWRVVPAITLPLLRPAIARRRDDRVPLHVHVVRRRADPRRGRNPTIEVEMLAAGDAARRRRRRRRAGARSS